LFTAAVITAVVSKSNFPRFRCHLATNSGWQVFLLTFNVSKKKTVEIQLSTAGWTAQNPLHDKHNVTAPKFFTNAIFIVVSYREAKNNLFKKIGASKWLKKYCR